MSCVFFGEMLSHEYVSKMGSAVRALYLATNAVRIRNAFNSARDFFVEAWPAAVGFKLVF